MWIAANNYINSRNHIYTKPTIENNNSTVSINVTKLSILISHHPTYYLSQWTWLNSLIPYAFLVKWVKPIGSVLNNARLHITIASYMCCIWFFSRFSKVPHRIERKLYHLLSEAARPVLLFCMKVAYPSCSQSIHGFVVSLGLTM